MAVKLENFLFHYFYHFSLLCILSLFHLLRFCLFLIRRLPNSASFVMVNAELGCKMQLGVKSKSKNNVYHAAYILSNELIIRR